MADPWFFSVRQRDEARKAFMNEIQNGNGSNGSGGGEQASQLATATATVDAGRVRPFDSMTIPADITRANDESPGAGSLPMPGGLPPSQQPPFVVQRPGSRPSAWGSSVNGWAMPFMSAENIASSPVGGDRPSRPRSVSPRPPPQSQPPQTQTRTQTQNMGQRLTVESSDEEERDELYVVFFSFFWRD